MVRRRPPGDRQEIPLPESFCAGGIGHIGEEVLLVWRNSPPTMYGFPKGHIEADKDETAAALERRAQGDEAGYVDAITRAAAMREVAEETGYLARIACYLGEVQRIGFQHNGEAVMKYIKLFGVQLVDIDSLIVPEQEPVLVRPELAMQWMLPEEAAFLRQHLDAVMAIDNLAA